MTLFRLALTTLVAAAATLASVVIATAAPAQITSNVNLRNGPGTNYAVVGVLRGGTQVDVTQCESSWCYVTASGAGGWVSSNYLAGIQQGQPGVTFGFQIGPDGKPTINFGVNQPGQPRPTPVPVPVPEPEDDIAQACFYTGTNFTGNSFCVEEGDSIPSLGRNWNDRIRSVEVFNGATVDVCRDADYVGVCQTLTRSKTRLASQLDRKVSSVEVY